MAEGTIKLGEMLTGTRELVQGVEATLLRRRRLSAIGAALALCGAVLQVVVSIVDKDYFGQLTTLWSKAGGISAAADPRALFLGVLGLLLVVVGFGAYLLLRWTRVLQKDSEEPFRYTVSIDPFNRIATAAFTLTNDERLSLLHYDLRERLDSRIGRFSLLDSRAAKSADPGAPSPDPGARISRSHIHITGEYAIRQDRRGRWAIHVMPMVRLGPDGSPLTMAYSVWYDLGVAGQDAPSPTTGAPSQAVAGASESPSHERPGTKSVDTDRKESLEAKQVIDVPKADLNSARYEQIVERVYSSIATEIYRKIEADVRAKIEWFPTRYLRAVALFHEAQDMARSNTVDAYDRALDLYRSAQRFFDLALMRDWRRRLVRLPLGWQVHARYLQVRARVEIGYVRCQVYRQIVALQTGRKPNAIFECMWRMDRVIEDLRAVHARLITYDPKATSADDDARQREAKSLVLGYFTFPRDRFRRALTGLPLEPDFVSQRRILFDAYTVAAMVHAVLGNTRKAREHLDAAVAVDPSLRGRDPMHLVAEADISPDLRRRVKLLRNATDMAPQFQIAQYRLAQILDRLFRDENDLNPRRADSVIAQYDEVLRINPGNIAAIAGKGYLYWLTSQGPEAEQAFREGIEFKSIVRETSIAELTYGLARTLAERGEHSDALDYYNQSALVDPEVAAWNIGDRSHLEGRYYVRISQAMVKRYVEHAQAIESKLKVRSATARSLGDSVHRAVQSFVVNDLANAHLNYYFRNGDPDSLCEAKVALERGEKANPDNAVIHFNLAVVHEWENQIGAALPSIERAVKLAPQWQAAWVAQTRSLSTYYLAALDDEIKVTESKVERLAALSLVPAPRFEPTAASAKPFEPAAADPSAVPASDARKAAEVGLTQRERLVLPSRADSPVAPPPTPTPVDVPATGESAKLHAELKVLRQQREALRANSLSNFVAALRELTRTSRLRHLLDPGSIDAPSTQWTENALALQSIDGLLWEQVEGADVLALKAVADSTTQYALKQYLDAGKNTDKGAGKKALETWQSALERCDRLNAFLADRFLPEDIDVCQWRVSVENTLQREPKPEIRAIVAHIVSFWLEEDPWHYWALRYWIGVLNLQELVACAERMLVFSGSHDQRRLGLVIEQLLVMVEGSQVGELRARAIELALKAAQACVQHEPLARSYYYLGRAHALENNWDEAVTAFDSAAARANADSEIQSARAAAHQGRAGDLVERGMLEEAFSAYVELISIDSGGPQRISAFEALTTISGKFASKARRAGAAARVRALVEEASARDKFADYERKRLDKALMRLRIGQCFGSSGLDRLPVVTPIAIEVASDLVPLIAEGESGLQDELQTEIADVRNRLRVQMGVAVPGFRFRGNEGDLTPGTYIIMLDEIPLVMGTVDVTQRFYEGSLDARAVGRLGARAQADPRSGKPGWWVPESETRNEQLDQGRMLHPRTFMMRHLEGLLQRNLAEFLGHTELALLLEDLKLPPEHALRDSAARNALLAALRSLLFEQVPIAPLADIVAAWPELLARHAHLRGRVEGLRGLPALRERLPGNDRAYRLFEIGPRFQSALRDNLHNADTVPVLGLMPELCQSMLTAVRNTLPQDLQREPTALVIADAPLRPHLREMVKLEWPTVPVLAVAELLDKATSVGRTALELE